MSARNGKQAAARWAALILIVGLSLSAASTASGLAQPVDASIWRRAMDLSGVGATDVKTRVRMIVFFDADCPYCATLWSRLRTAATIRSVRWIPVPYLDSSSLGAAVALPAFPAADSKRPQRGATMVEFTLIAPGVLGNEVNAADLAKYPKGITQAVATAMFPDDMASKSVNFLDRLQLPESSLMGGWAWGQINW